MNQEVNLLNEMLSQVIDKEKFYKDLASSINILPASIKKHWFSKKGTPPSRHFASIKNNLVSTIEKQIEDQIKLLESIKLIK